MPRGAAAQGENGARAVQIAPIEESPLDTLSGVVSPMAPQLATFTTETPTHETADMR